MNDPEQLEILEEFISEVRDLLEELEPEIINLGAVSDKEGPLSNETIDKLHAIFRLFHSIKGSAGFLQFNTIVKVSHAAETLLDLLRTGQIRLISNHVDLLCQSCDFTKEALDFLEKNLSDKGMETSSQDLIADLKKAADSPPADEQETLPETEQAEQPKEPEEPEKQEESPPEQEQPLPEIDLELSTEQLITPETVKHFLQEADDLFQEIEQDLLVWSDTPQDMKPVDRLFRNIHSFKGNCGFLGLTDLEKLSHKIETILSEAINDNAINKDKLPDMLLQLVDTFKETLNSLAEEGPAEIDGLSLYLELLDEFLPKKDRQEESTSTKLGDILVEQGTVGENDVEQALEIQNKPIGEILVESGITTEKDIDKALGEQKKRRVKKDITKTASGAATLSRRQDIRVDLDKLDSLINLIGEMVIAENMVIHNPDLLGLELENFNKAGQHLIKIVRELQEMAMTIRMIPVSGLFRRMMRLVHDLSRKSGKKVDLELVGETTEMDKTVIEKITDPLVHLIRNSMDHGIEDPEERKQAEKPKTGRITLSASHEEGDVLITIVDDGQGLAKDKILAKAIDRGLLEDDGSQMSNKEIFNLIFLPGFSTAEKVTDVSGRGVGMDVVRQNLEAIKGKVEIESTLGKGTTIILRIPLTLAIIDGMLVRTGKALYILPILSIKESFQPTADAITVSPDGQELVRVRKNLLSIVRLHELHNVTPDNQELEKGILIVLEAGDDNFCLFVDELMGQQQTVIKGLSDYIAKANNVRGVSGCTILGNGEVCLIIDVRSLRDFTESLQTG